MTTMSSRSEQVERLLAGLETSPGSGVFETDARLMVEEVHQKSDRAVSTARIAVRLDNDFDIEDSRRRYHPDRRVLVSTDESDPARRQFLFLGYPRLQSGSWDGRQGQEGETCVLEPEHVFERLSRDRKAWIYGRYARNGDIEDGLAISPEEYSDKSILVTALPCIFNPDGIANQSVVPLRVMSPSGGTRFVHIFTWEGGPAARWTYATALRYLIWFHLIKEGPVFEGNIFNMTDDIAAGLAGTSSPLADALRREPNSLVCEATHLVEALSHLCSAAGLHLAAEIRNLGGRPVTELRLWAAHAGRCRSLYLARGGRHSDGTPRYNVTGRSAAEILADNNTYRGTISWDHRGMVNHPMVIGGIKQYEMTVPLWPGWAPRSQLDNVAPPQRAAAKALALLPDQVETLGEKAESSSWFRVYHRHGSLFKYNADAGRLWILNEDGFYTGAIYNRNAPFDHYGPFDFSTVAGPEVTGRGKWMRRPRRLLPTISTSQDGRPLGIWIEISFDSGVTWQQQSSGVRVLEGRAGVYFDCVNPTEITPAGVDPAVQNLWYALIEQTFRVRVTAVIESDERLMAEYSPDRLNSPTLYTNTIVISRPKLFQFVSRSGTANVLHGVGAEPVGRDDSPMIAALAEQLASANQDRRVHVVPAIPWIETDYELGDRITDIRGRDIRFATVSGPLLRYPAVLARKFIMRDGRYDTELTLGITDIPEGDI